MNRPEPFEQLDALRIIGEFAESWPHVADTPAAQIIAATTGRAHETMRAISHLVPLEMAPQAAMLVRSLFEDMVVAHWLADREEPDYLVERFFDHHDAMALHQARVRADTGWQVGTSVIDDITHLKVRETELSDRYGKNVVQSWWAADPDGKRVSLWDIVQQLEKSTRFGPRFSGEEPLLIRWYQVVQKWANQYLHHTAIGLPVKLERGVRVPIAWEDPSLPFWICFCTYWTFGQQVYLQLLIEGESAAAFNEIFVPRVTSVFLEPLRVMERSLDG